MSLEVTSRCQGRDSFQVLRQEFKAINLIPQLLTQDLKRNHGPRASSVFEPTEKRKLCWGSYCAQTPPFYSLLQIPRALPLNSQTSCLGIFWLNFSSLLFAFLPRPASSSLVRSASRGCSHSRSPHIF